MTFVGGDDIVVWDGDQTYVRPACGVDVSQREEGVPNDALGDGEGKVFPGLRVLEGGDGRTTGVLDDVEVVAEVDGVYSVARGCAGQVALLRGGDSLDEVALGFVGVAGALEGEVPGELVGEGLNSDVSPAGGTTEQGVSGTALSRNRRAYALTECCASQSIDEARPRSLRSTRYLSPPSVMSWPGSKETWPSLRAG